MNKQTLLVIIFFLSFSLKSQEKTTISSSFKKSDNIIDLGIGLSGYGVPFHGAFEHFISDDISIGLTANYLQYNSIYSTITSHWDFYYGGVKGNYHFQKLLKINNEKIDIYGGATLGYWYGIYSDNSNFSSPLTSYGNTPYLVLQVGGRYLLSKNIGGFAELGGGNLSSLTLGLSFKF